MRGAELRRGDIDAEAALRDLREEPGKSRGHGGVGQRMNAPGRVAARRDEKARAASRHLLQRGVHLRLAVTVVPGGHETLRRVGSDHERDVRKDAGLLEEGWGPRQLHRGTPGELVEAPPDLCGGERRLVHVEHGQLEVDGRPEDLRRRLRQASVSVVPRVERAGHDRGGGGPAG